LSETSRDAAATQEIIETLARSIIELAKAQKIPEGDLTIDNMSIHPKMKWDSNAQTSQFVGSTYERRIKVRFHVLRALTQFLAKLPAAKQLQIGVGEFSSSKQGTIEKELLAEAIADARGTADELVRGVGGKIAGVQSISNRGFNVVYSQGGRSGAVNAIDISSLSSYSGRNPVVLNEGRITLRQNVYIIYLLE